MTEIFNKLKFHSIAVILKSSPLFPSLLIVALTWNFLSSPYSHTTIWAAAACSIYSSHSTAKKRETTTTSFAWGSGGDYNEHNKMMLMSVKGSLTTMTTNLEREASNCVDSSFVGWNYSWKSNFTRVFNAQFFSRRGKSVAFTSDRVLR